MTVQIKIALFPYLIFIGLLSSCAITIPKSIDEKIIDIPALHVVRQNVDAYIERRVRWGGVIANVVNKKNTTVLEIVDHPLSKEGRPIETDQTQGRFLARFKGFLDPVVYATGREITVVGTVSRETKQLIDQFEYTYPEIIVDSFNLWRPAEKDNDYNYDPYWPYFGPWYPPYYPRRYY